MPIIRNACEKYMLLHTESVDLPCIGNEPVPTFLLNHRYALTPIAVSSDCFAAIVSAVRKHEIDFSRRNHLVYRI